MKPEDYARLLGMNRGELIGILVLLMRYVVHLRKTLTSDPLAELERGWSDRK